MQLRAKIIRLPDQQNLRPFNLPQIKPQDRRLLRRRHDRVTEGGDVVAEVLRVVDDAREEVFLVGLEGEGFDLVLPLD
jgi:hypothetical protein